MLLLAVPTTYAADDAASVLARILVVNSFFDTSLTNIQDIPLFAGAKFGRAGKR